MKVLIIGAGWYGCYAALKLKDNFEVKIVDYKDIFTGSSSKNQNRLHLGYHYPRSKSTISECQEGYSRFKEQFEFLLKDIPNNYYFISSKDSLTSLDEFKEQFNTFICKTSDSKPFQIQNVEDECFKTEEKYIDFEKSSCFFKEQLQSIFKIIPKYNTIDEILEYQEENYDVLINCTYNHLNPIPFDSYEIFMTLLYSLPCDNELFAYTIMDGNFFSLFPYIVREDEVIYSLTSVKHGVVYSGDKLKDISKYSFVPTETKHKIESEFKQFLPDFNGRFLKYEFSYKTKPKTNSDDRSVRYSIENKNNTKIFNFYGGKITGIFQMEKILNESLY